MGTKIDTVTARERLPARVAPYWHKVTTGRHLGFRKTVSDSTGTWVARYPAESGLYQQRTLGSLDTFLPHERFDAALKAANVWFAHINNGGSTESLTVGAAFQLYVRKATDEGRSSTAKDLQGRYKRWLEPDSRLANTKVDALTQEQVRSWRTKLTNSPAIPQDKSKPAVKQKAPSSINRDMAVFKAVLNWAFQNGYTSTDAPWRHQLAPIKNATRRRQLYLAPEKRRLLAQSAPSDLAAFINALCLIPLRPGAVAKLTVGDLNAGLGLLTVNKDKAGAGRTISLPPPTIEFLQGVAGNKPAHAPLFSRSDGQAWNKDSWKYPFKAAVADAKLPQDTTAYTLRHCVITDLISLHGLDPVTVAGISGTSLLMIQEHYGHLLEHRASTALAQLHS